MSIAMSGNNVNPNNPNSGGVYYELTAIDDPFYDYSVKVWNTYKPFTSGGTTYLGSSYDDIFPRRELKVTEAMAGKSLLVEVLFANNSNPSGYDSINGIYENNIGTMNWFNAIDAITRIDIDVILISPSYYPPHDPNDPVYGDTYWYRYNKIFYRAKSPVQDGSVITNPFIWTGCWDLHTIIVNEPTDLPLDGVGTEQDPYVISRCRDLVYLSTYPNSYFILANDIDMTESDDWSIQWGWVTSGWPTIERFTGVLDGQGHKLINFYDNSSMSASLFNILDGGIVRNLGMENATLFVQQNGGFIAGSCVNGASIDNCYITGTIYTGLFSEHFGGIVGGLGPGCFVTNSYMTVNIFNHGPDSVCGAIAGKYNGLTDGIFSSFGTVSNCYWAGIHNYIEDNGQSGWTIEMVSKDPKYVRKAFYVASAPHKAHLGGFVPISFGYYTSSYYDKNINTNLTAIGGLTNLNTVSPWGITTVWTRQQNTNYGYPYLVKFKGYPSWETSLILPWTDVGYADIKQYIISQWKYADLIDNNGNSIIRINLITDPRASWAYSGNDLVLSVTISVGDEGISVPVTFKEIALYKVFAGGLAMTRESFIATTLSLPGEQLKVNYRIKIPV